MALFDKLNQDYVAQNVKLAQLGGLFMPLLQFLVGATFLGVLWAGGYGLIEKRITLGSFVMFNTYMGMLVWPMIAFGWVVNLIQRGMASFNRIDDIIHQKPLIAAPASPLTLPSPIRGEIRPSWRDAELPDWGCGAESEREDRSRTTVAIVGHTGSGKTSVAQMIPRMVDPTTGEVAIDGVGLRDLDPAAIRKEIGFCRRRRFCSAAALRTTSRWGFRKRAASRLSMQWRLRD